MDIRRIIRILTCTPQKSEYEQMEGSPPRTHKNGKRKVHNKQTQSKKGAQRAVSQ